MKCEYQCKCAIGGSNRCDLFIQLCLQAEVINLEGEAFYVKFCIEILLTLS